TDVLGNSIPAMKGDDVNFLYDRNSILEEVKKEKIVLKAKHAGALEFKDDIVSVGKHLIIQGDVGPETGSITFEGSVAVYGTVLAGYAVTATGDISVEGNEGITNAKLIQSTEGD